MKALVTVERKGERLLTVVEVGRAVLQDPGLEARKAWVPISVQVVTPELAEKIGVPETAGVRVTRLLPEGSTSGLKVGDIITAIDGTPIQASQPSDADLFATMIRQYRDRFDGRARHRARHRATETLGQAGSIAAFAARDEEVRRPRFRVPSARSSRRPIASLLTSAMSSREFSSKPCAKVDGPR